MDSLITSKTRIAYFRCHLIAFSLIFIVVQAQPISKDDKQITYRSVNEPGPVHVSMVQAKVDTMDKVC